MEVEEPERGHTYDLTDQVQWDELVAKLDRACQQLTLPSYSPRKWENVPVRSEFL